ncbi:TerC family protein [Geobacter sulfurreducens]|uniref:Membrane protein, TerC family n=1 Tax=Geobacter sulfurreducens (strain ATCC 51573 / DSM 12127 / PCA) TaxID=243231 RepID=Q74CV1_GEOSL|nr:TerC family protein [Geobacter sulfurreducens]AAR34944.1 membrane protein, TerC family [Geobacter sulfurreducens PCA]ADI84405.2 membrane protein, TerC family [Geobacter sulfurreducens KN400]AJY71548.1 integral membrane protein TerC [Geobacter sulfurreducens]QVW36738.1 TerC family protein [Geobacter sulfurreducens]UAC05575.1 TerC family protein [Geobacter sulfurreducens]
MATSTILWGGFILLVVIMLAVDLGMNRKSHRVSFKEALGWSILWVGLALAFNVGIYFVLGQQKALEFLTGYLIEKSLSVDNLFVFIMIFTVFGVRGELQARVLKWGILGALIMRVVFIFLGAELLERFQWLFYIFGAVLIYTASKMAFGASEEMDPDKNLMVRLARKVLPMTRKIRGDWFFTRRLGLWVASPLFMVLLVVESSDLVFALDSIPAIFAITLDPFIVLTSNVFAIMGLRALYFLLAEVMGMFAYLKYGISFILAFVGIKMILIMLGVHIPIAISLGVIVLSLVVAMGLSLLANRMGYANRVSGEIP